MSRIIKPVLRYPGAKWNLAEWIIGHFPPHKGYLEPFCGSAAVFFTKKPSKVETLNDLDGRIINLFKVMRERPHELVDAISLTPWARAEYEASYEPAEDPIESARRYLVRCWMSYGAKLAAPVGWKNDVQGRIGTYYPLVWKGLPDRILATVDRLKDAQIENRPALEVIERHNVPTTLIYADPPYVHETRSGKLYAHEMTNGGHTALLDALDEHSGPVIISGYDNDLYNQQLTNWTKVQSKGFCDGGRARTEVLWLNPTAAEAQRQTVMDL